MIELFPSENTCALVEILKPMGLADFIVFVTATTLLDFEA